VKNPVIRARLILFSLLAAVAPLTADAQCRKAPRTGTDWVLEGRPEYPATIHFEESLGEVTVSLKGTICDKDRRPIEGVWGQLVLFEVPEGRSLESLNAEDFRSGAVDTSSQKAFVSTRNGSFEVGDLRPGDYVFLVEWPDAADTDRLYFDFRITHGYTVQAQYTRP
jgi:hypothetical protein